MPRWIGFVMVGSSSALPQRAEKEVQSIIQYIQEGQIADFAITL
ncbi:hypothetical protein [Paenibacillus lacisoli]|nr:hypothetical protein [Paenibacillus sp. JX-17]